MKAALDLSPIAIFVQFVVLNWLPRTKGSNRAEVGGLQSWTKWMKN